jgi:hypothetical protein
MTTNVLRALEFLPNLNSLKLSISVLEVAQLEHSMLQEFARLADCLLALMLLLELELVKALALPVQGLMLLIASPAPQDPCGSKIPTNARCKQSAKTDIDFDLTFQPTAKSAQTTVLNAIHSDAQNAWLPLPLRDVRSNTVFQMSV